MKSQHNECEYSIYIPESRTYEPVSEEIYNAYYRPIWRTFQKEHYHNRCSCPGYNWHLCSGDCFMCSYHTAGNILSLEKELDNAEDTPFTLYETLSDDSLLIEPLIEEGELRCEIHRLLEELDTESREICQLIMEGYSERQAATRMHMARSTFKRHWNRVKEILAKSLADYR